MSTSAIMAVLTGDFIGSTRMPNATLDAGMAILRDYGRCLVHPGSEYRIIPPDIFRGDAWQIAVSDPGTALRVAVYLKSSLRARLEIDTRLAVAIGGIETLVPDRVSSSRGEAFLLSGRTLDAMSRSNGLSGALPLRAGALARWMPTTLHLVGALMDRWTRRQCEIVERAVARRNWTRASIASTLIPPVSKQAVSATLDAAGWTAVADLISTFEATEWVREIGFE